MSRARKLSVQDWRLGFGVVDPNEKEIISFSLWQRKDYVSATTAALTFFDTVAQGPTSGNIIQAGQLQNGQAFLVQAIRVAVQPRTVEGTTTAVGAVSATETAVEDMLALCNDGTLELKVMDKSYGIWPIWMLPAGGGVTGQIAPIGATAATSILFSSFAQNGIPDPRSVFVLPIPVVIPPQVSFRAILTWDVAKTLQRTPVPITVVLDGELMRPKQ